MHAGPSASLRVARKPAGRVRQAVRDNNVALLSRLQHKVDLRNTDRNRLTSLAWAALEGSLEVFEWLLLDYGHDDQELSRDADGNTVFHLLASVPSHPNPLVRPSPDFPARPPTRSAVETAELTLRMAELYHTLFPFLLDWSNSGGKTALHVAAQAGNYAFISLLCELGADGALSDLQGNTPLHYAAAWGHVECARVLLDAGAGAAAPGGGAGVGERNFEGFTPADYAFSAQVRAALDALARDAAGRRAREDRDRRRREAGAGEAGGAGLDGARQRSGSVSTSASVGSGPSYSSGRYRPDRPDRLDRADRLDRLDRLDTYDRLEPALPPLPRDDGAGPPTARAYAAYGYDAGPPTARPGLPLKSPSVPYAPAALPAAPSSGMRRVNSAQTASTAGREGSVRSAHSGARF